MAPVVLYRVTSLRFCAPTIRRHIRHIEMPALGSGAVVAIACTSAWLVIGHKQVVDAAGARVGV